MPRRYTCKICGAGDFLADEMVQTGCTAYGTFNWYECKRCHSKKMKAFRKTEKGQRWSRNKTLKHKYGITIDGYEKALKDQNNCCMICKSEFSDKIKPDVDHHHDSKRFRGILCHSCNLAIGYLKENEDIIWNMLEYLKSTTWSIKSGESDVQQVH